MTTAAKYFYLFFAALVVFSAVAPHAAFADTNPIKSNVWDVSILKGPLLVCSGDGSGGFPQCSSLCDLVAQVANIIYFFIAVVIWIIAPIMIVWSGLRLMLSRGNPEGMSGAKKLATGTATGLLIVLGAWVFLYTFVNVLNIAGIGGFSNGGQTAACVLQ